jgi:hypothetical protein
LGRSLTVAGDDMLVTFGREDEKSPAAVHLYDVGGDNQTNPKLVRAWTSDTPNLRLDCQPINAVMRKGYDHFVVSCAGGRLFMGTFEEDRSKSKLKLVRDYDRAGRSRRALYIDKQKNLLYAFPTDDGKVATNDFITKDAKTYDPTSLKSKNEPNEVPDEYEYNRYRIRNSGPQRSRYQFIVYDIAAERAKGFPLRSFDDEKDSVAQAEQRWLYFSLANWDGTEDIQLAEDERQYRTNIYSVQPDPESLDSFYISHRGKQSKQARFSNNIIRVTVKRNPKTPGVWTQDAFEFQRVYGMKKELDVNNHFPGDFRVQSIKGQVMLIVNHFKDLVNFRKDAYFSIAAKLIKGRDLEENGWRSEISSSNQAESFYHVAANERGKILSCSFYSNSVIPLELEPGTAINLGWDEIKKIE